MLRPKNIGIRLAVATTLLLSFFSSVTPSLAAPASWYQLGTASIKGVSISPPPPSYQASDSIAGISSSTTFDLTYAEANNGSMAGGDFQPSSANSNWTSTIIKFSSSDSIDDSSFASRGAFTNQPVTNGDIFIVKVDIGPDAGFERVRYYKLIANVAAGSAPDTTPPTFTSSSSFSVVENIATSVTAATLTVSEDSTLTISSGADASLFDIFTSDNVTAVLKFKTSPNFEAPSDNGGNNIYDLTITATDTAGNANTQSITIAVTDVAETSSFNSLLLTGSATSATYRTSIVVTANVSVASKITFAMDGKVLPGCKNRTTSGSVSSFSATCNWKPSKRGVVSITAVATPTGAGISGATSNPVNVMVANRIGTR
jgi:hypothetical protein